MDSITRRKFIKTSTVTSIGLSMGCSIKTHFDLVIRNGLVYNGTKNKPKLVDLGIIGDKISVIDKLPKNVSANTVLDAEGLAVSPGFIDIHTHTDVELIVNPKAESKIRQGVTTEVAGNCGFSPFPYNVEDVKELHDRMMKNYNLDLKWKNLKEFFEIIESHKTALNYMTFTGHGDLRAYVIGKNDVKPTPDQLQKMQRVLEESMDYGSIGLSTGLEYSPGSYAKTDELIALCQTVASKNGLYATHMRNEDDTVEEAIKEALLIAEKSGVNLEISHFKACNKNNWHKIENMLELIHNGRNRGIDVHADRYPYHAWGTGLTSFLPLWSRQGNNDEVISRLQDKKLIPKIQSYSQGRAQRIGGWNKVIISNCDSDVNSHFEGKSILECAEMTSKEPSRFILDLLVEEKNGVGVIGFAMSEQNLQKVLSDDLVMIGSDGTAVAPYGKLGKNKPHPRYYGTFPRVLGRFSRDNNWMNLQTAIYKMTGMPAMKLNLKQRGVLKKGYFADITIFNPDSVIDKATFTNPHQYPEGIEYVIVNGKIVIDKSEHTGILPGRVLRQT